MFALFERVRLRVDPRQTGTVVRWLTANWNGNTGLRIHWDNGPLEDLFPHEIEKEKADAARPHENFAG